MKPKWMKLALPLVVIGAGIAGMAAINATAKKSEEIIEVDDRPVVSIQPLEKQDHNITLTGYGEVKPKEMTLLSAQVTGKVVHWNPNFVAGGLVKKGDLLFTIEKDAYQAAVLQAEAQLNRAQAQLITEKAQSQVAKNEAKTLPAQLVTDLYLRKPQLISAEADVKSAEAQLRLAKRDLRNCETRAPYDALVISRNLGLGQFIQQGVQVAEIYNVETAEVLVPIAGFETEFLPTTLEGTNAQVSRYDVKSASADHSLIHSASTREGVVARDLGVIDNQTRMNHVIVEITDPYAFKQDKSVLKFGDYVAVNFKGKTLKDVYQIPQDLVSHDKLWVVNGEHKLESRAVNVLREESTFFYVTSQLNESDQLLITLPEYPQVGMEVKFAQPVSDNIAKQ